MSGKRCHADTRQTHTTPAKRKPLPVHSPCGTHSRIPACPPVCLRSGHAFHTRGRPHALSYLPGISAPLLHVPYSDPCLRPVPAASAAPAGSAAKADLPAPGVFPVPPGSMPPSVSEDCFSSGIPLLSVVLFRSDHSWYCPPFFFHHKWNTFICKVLFQYFIYYRTFLLLML